MSANGRSSHSHSHSHSQKAPSGTRHLQVSTGISSETVGLAYDVCGPVSPVSPSASLLILVNGYQRNRQDFRALRKRLHAHAPSLITVALDNRGVGETHWKGPFSLADMASDVSSLASDLCREYALDQYSLLGISMGGMIAQAVASAAAVVPMESGEQVPKVSHLILVSTTAGGKERVWGAVKDREYSDWPTDLEAMRAKMRSYFGSKFIGSSPLLIDAMAKNILKNAGDPSVENTAREGARQQFAASARFDRSLLPGQSSQSLHSSQSGEGGPGLPQVLVISGDEDAVIPPENSKILSSVFENSSLKFYSKVGHLILIEEPETFAYDLLNFLFGEDLRP